MTPFGEQAKASRESCTRPRRKHKTLTTGRPIFSFPTTHHLLITTPGAIYAWDHKSLNRLFSSSKRGILAAKESRDGSQLLAIADRHVVVLHDCKHDRENSYGLEASESSVRLLEYTPDTRNLFLSTSITGAIQCYSVGREHTEDVGKEHPSPPTVMSVSPDGEVMISASENPTVVYFQDLKSRMPARQLHPSATEKSVVIAAFHPERPNVFLLGFRDGTMAAYDATGAREGRRVGVDPKNAKQDLDHVVREIGRFDCLQRVTNRASVQVTTLPLGQDRGLTAAMGIQSSGVTSAAFLPGYKSRAVSVGRDGRCRLVEFENGGKVLRTWDVGPGIEGTRISTPLTSVSILGVREKKKKDKIDSGNVNGDTLFMPIEQAVNQQSDMVEKPDKQAISHIIAVGRTDGTVILYDALGLKIQAIIADKTHDRIISVEWIKGPSPRALPSGPSRPVHDLA